MSFLVSCPGSCGEFIQGRIGGASFMVTCPVDRFSRAALSDEPTALPEKSAKALALTKNWLGADRELYISLTSDIPVGKGMASSTADMAAVAQAAALAMGKTLTSEEIAKICLSVEPSDATFFPGIMQFDYREGKVIRAMGNCPAFQILVYDGGGTIDTLAFNARRDLIDLQTKHEGEIKEALTLFEMGIEEGNRAYIGEAATMSAYVNQDILPKPQLDIFYQTGKECGAYGVVCAHSGTVLGVLLDPDADGLAVRKEIDKHCGDEMYYLDTVMTCNTGMTVKNEK